MKGIAIVVVLGTLACLPRAAEATAQVPEILHVNGRVFSMQATPLAPLLVDREDLRALFPARNSGCWRGYLGTWSVEGDRLYLVSLEREEAGAKDWQWTEIALSKVLGSAAVPVPATWFSGTLRLPLGGGGRYVHMGFGTVHDRELRIFVVRGVVTKHVVVDSARENRGRSVEDLTWCSLPRVVDGDVPSDDGSWHDARDLETAAFKKAVPSGSRFRTRGVLDREEDGRWTLRIPETPVTERVSFPLTSSGSLALTRTWPHVEAEVTWRADGDRLVLDLAWLRVLKAGETIHHPAFPLPELAPDEGSESEAVVPTVESSEEAARVFGVYHLVTLQGPLEADKEGLASVVGVDVQPEASLRGVPVTCTGRLEKWVVTERLLRLNPPELEPFRTRGPGTYYRLVDPRTERLAAPVRKAEPAANPEGAAPK